MGFCFGEFDLPNEVDFMFLKEARKQCSFVVLGLASDERCAELLGVNRPYQRFAQRMMAVWPYVDSVVHCDDPVPWLRDLRPDVFIVGPFQSSEGRSHAQKLVRITAVGHPAIMRGRARRKVHQLLRRSVIDIRLSS